MATLSKGISLGATEQLTNTKLHNLVDLGTVTAIVNADISDSALIALSKLATSTATYMIVYNSSGVPVAVDIIGAVGVSNAGVFSANNVIDRDNPVCNNNEFVYIEP